MGNGVTEVRNKRPVIPSLDYLSTELRRAGYTESASIIRRLVTDHGFLRFSYAKTRQLTGPVVYVWIGNNILDSPTGAAIVVGAA